MVKFKSLNKYSMTNNEVDVRLGRKKKKPKMYKTSRKERRAVKASKYGIYKIPKKKKHRPNYHVYIVSRQWKKRRSKYYSRYGKKCFVCFTDKRITLHHNNYQNLGYEKDKDLVALCWYHHDEIHNLVLNNKDIKLNNAHVVYKKLDMLKL